MKKYLVLLLIFIPAVSFGAPSVRMLGNQPALSAAINSGAKVTPVKSSGEGANVASSARVGSLQAKAKSSALTPVSTVSSSSRFPVIQPAYSYNAVATPNTGGSSSGSSQVPANIDVAAIVDAVTHNIENNYYSINEVYNNNEFVTAVKNVVKDAEDPRMFDVVRTSNPFDEHGMNAPTGFLYIWVEEN